MNKLKQHINNQKPMVLMLLTVLIVFGLIFGYKGFGWYMTQKYLSNRAAPIVTVAAMEAKLEDWQPMLKSPGTITAINGVDVTTEVAGIISEIYYSGGETVAQGDELIQINADAELAQLHKLQADEELAKIVLERNKAQYKAQAISQAILEAAEADLKAKSAQVAEQEAIIAKKSIRAPFDGKIGIIDINLGQYLTPGEKIVTLQQLDPVYVYFNLPQVEVPKVSPGQKVKVRAVGFPGKIFSGKIDTIEPKLNEATRNIQIQSVVDNPNKLLLPGMFTQVEIDAGPVEQHITLPQTAISFNPYGDIVYIITESGKKDKKTGKPILTVNQSFVTLGDRRGDQVAVLKGLKVGDKVVVAGQNKLKNGTQVVINNSVMPSNLANPKPVHE